MEAPDLKVVPLLSHLLSPADEIVLLHGKLLRATGGTPEFRNPGLLKSAAFGVNAGFGDSEQYPTVEEKAAWLVFVLVCNHAEM